MSIFIGLLYLSFITYSYADISIGNNLILNNVVVNTHQSSAPQAAIQLIPNSTHTPKCDGITNDTEAIQFEINHGNATLPSGKCMINSPLYMGDSTNSMPSTMNSLSLKGQGRYATTISWAGQVNQTMLSVRGPILDNTISGIHLDGENIAGYGIWATQIDSSKMDQVLVTSITKAFYVFTVNSTSNNTNFGSCGNIFNQISTGNPSNPQVNGIILNGTVSTRLDACRIQMNEIEINYGGGIGSCGIYLGFTDNNMFNTGLVYGPNNGGHGVCLDNRFDQEFPLENHFDEVAIMNGISGVSGLGGNWFNPLPTSDGEQIPNLPNVHYCLYNGVCN